MFNEKHGFTINNDTFSETVNLAFVKSQSIQAFPCGRRRSTSYSKDDSRIPFDPEARLNTEANNRKHSSINGFTQTYIEHWDDQAVLSLAGYLFTITLEDVLDNDKDSVETYKDLNFFCKKITDLVGDSDAKSIYANILIDNTQLFAGTYVNSGLAYYTDVLDSFTSENLKDKSAIDLYISDNSIKSDVELDNYYFSGLAFSTKPVATLYNGHSKEIDFKTRDECILKNNKKINKIVSLRLLDKKVDDEGESWKIHEPARLPYIEHGDTENSVVIFDALIKNGITVKNSIVSENIVESKNLNVTDTGTIENLSAQLATIEQADIGNIIVDSIEVDEIKASNIEADEITTPALYQDVGTDENKKIMKVPVIELIQDGDFWQLQISRIGEK